MSTTISLEQKALVALFRAAGRVRRQFDAKMDDFGLSQSQYNVLRILRGAKGELPIMTIRDRMMDPEPSITRLVDRLEEKGLTERHRSSSDRRRISCRLTEKGLLLVNSLDVPVDEMDRRIMRRLTQRQLRSLIELVDCVGAGAA